MKEAIGRNVSFNNHRVMRRYTRPVSREQIGEMTHDRGQRHP